MSLWAVFYKLRLGGTSWSVNSPDVRWRRAPRGIRRFTVLELPDRLDWNYNRIWRLLPLVYPDARGLNAIANGFGIVGGNVMLSLNLDYTAGAATRIFREAVTALGGGNASGSILAAPQRALRPPISE